MCIGDDEPGGPRRCSGEALTRCIRATTNAENAATRTAVLEAERADIDNSVVQIDDIFAALNGTLSPEREAELLERAERFRHEEAIAELRERLGDIGSKAATVEALRLSVAESDGFVADANADWAVAVESQRARWDHLDDGDDSAYEARLRAEYERQCQAMGEEPTPDGLDDFINTERMANASYDEWRSDVREGSTLQQSRDIARDHHRALADALDTAGLETEIDSRIHAPEFAVRVSNRDDARTELEAATTQFNQAKADYNDDDAASRVALDSARERLHEAYADYKVTEDQLGHYKDCTAQYVDVLGQREPLPEYAGNTLGAATQIGDFAEGSRDWHNARTTGFGGSDVPKLLGLSKYGTPADVVNGKVTPIDDAAIAQQEADRLAARGSAGRGHAWEPVLARQFATENPDLSVQRTKASWKGSEEWQNLNVDAIIVDGDGKAAAIWEGKTANNRDDWKDGIPTYYRPQLAHAMDVAGVKRAALTVNIDDNDVRTYWMNADEPLDPADPKERTYQDRKAELSAQWDKVKAKRANPPDPNAPAKRNSGTFKFVNNPASDSSHQTNADTVRQLATYRGCSSETAERLIRDNLDNGMKADEAVRHAYRSYRPANDPNRRFVVVDFETNGTHAGKHQIIQTGYQVIDGAGNVHSSANTLHDINPKLAPTVGTGMADVHQIQYSQLDGKTPFAKSAEREHLARLAADPNVTIVAHNANFEMSFLRAHGIRTDRVIDTMNLSRKFDHQSTGAKLSDFTAAHGVEYINAHDAYQDVDMTRRAIANFWAGQ